jgi:hypothetical protein
MSKINECSKEIATLIEKYSYNVFIVSLKKIFDLWIQEKINNNTEYKEIQQIKDKLKYLLIIKK